MKLRSTIVLLVIFSAVLGVMAWMDYTQIPVVDPTSVLPTLADVSPGEIRRIEIDRGLNPLTDKTHGRIILARRMDGSWQMLEPVDTAAEPEMVETFARNLKEMRKSNDAGTITDDPKNFGLDAPAAEIKIYARADTTPTATLEVGKAAGERLYVRSAGSKGIEVVDSRLLSALRLPTTDWRDKALFHMPSYKVASLSVKDASPGRNLKLERGQGRWKMTEPVRAPAESDKVEGLVAELSALRLIGGPDGFVADGVTDFAPYGLAKPEMTIEIVSSDGKIQPQSLLFGKPVPDHPGQVYAKRGDQDDVIRVDTKILRESLPNPTSLRSHKAVDFMIGRVVRFRIEQSSKVFDVARVGPSWKLIEPTAAGADPALVQSFLTRLNDLTSADFLDASQVKDPMLNPPVCRIKVWQVEPGDPLASSTSESIWASDEILKREPTADMSLGRVDKLRKTIFGRIAGDTMIQAFPDTAVDLIPKNDFAFRDRIVLTIPPENVSRLTIARAGYEPVTVQSPGSGSKTLHWRVVAPVETKGDDTAITALLVMLSSLRSESWVTDKLGDGKAYGLDAPWLTIHWEASAEPSAAGETKPPPGSGTLRIGNHLPKSESYYANVDGDSRVFVLTQAQVAAFEVELRDKLILAFAPEKVEKVTLYWPKRTLAIGRKPTPKGTPAEWAPEPGFDSSGVDLSHFTTVVAALNDLKTTRYIQDRGPFSSLYGLTPPRLTFAIHLTGEASLHWLQIGNATADGQVLATDSKGSEGPVFVISQGAAWTHLLLKPGQANDLPDNVFVPEPERPAVAPR